MINFDDIINENQSNHYSICPYIPDHPCRTLVIGSSGSGKASALLNLANHKPDIDKMCLYAKDLYEPKCQFLIKKVEILI